MPKYFTLQQAERILPEVAESLRQAMAVKKLFDETEAELRAEAQRIALLGGVRLDPAKLARQRTRRDELTSRLKESLAELQQHGCLIKDLNTGLVDFPTWFGDREVYLCWKFGEPSIRFWHGEEGFRGRKEIDQEFLSQHRGDSEAQP